MKRGFEPARLYTLALEVIPSTGAAYQVTVEQRIRLRPSQMPAVGAVIPVKYLPEQPDIEVALINPEDNAREQR